MKIQPSSNNREIRSMRVTTNISPAFISSNSCVLAGRFRLLPLRISQKNFSHPAAKRRSHCASKLESSTNDERAYPNFIFHTSVESIQCAQNLFHLIPRALSTFASIFSDGKQIFLTKFLLFHSKSLQDQSLQTKWLPAR